MNHIGVLLLASILPIILLLYFIYKKDQNKEPFSLLFILFCSGILSCFLVLELSNLLGYIFPFMDGEVNSFFNTVLYAFIGVAFIEEICKWIMVYFIGYHHKEFEELFDITVYAVFVSLGFAFYENIAYVLTVGEIKTAFLRAVSAVPAHACDAVFMGYYFSLAKKFRLKKRKDLEKSNLFLSILVPTFLHGIYDLCLLLNYRIFVFAFLLFVVYLYIVSIRKINEMTEFKNIKVVYCKNCGAKLESNVCSRCGNRN